MEMGHVCKRWEFVSQLPWCDVKTYNCGHQIVDTNQPKEVNVQKAMSHFTCSLLQLVLCNGCIGVIKPIMLQKFTDLRNLTLRNCIIVEEYMNEIIQLKTLVFLDFSNSELNAGKKLQEHESSKFSLVNLEHFNLDGAFCGNGTISDKCKKLKYLNISMFYSPGLVLEDLAKYENLEQLILQNTHKVNEATLSTIVFTMRNLKVLDCSFCREVTDVGIIALLKRCQNLNSLNIVRTSITAESLKFAVKLTKFRANGPALAITAFCEFNQFENMSPLLKIIQVSEMDVVTAGETFIGRNSQLIERIKREMNDHINKLNIKN